MGKVQPIYQDPQVSHATREVSGLREALAGEQAAQERVANLNRRLAEARGQMELRGKDRAALMAQAAAGQEVIPAALRRADEAIADAEAAVTLAQAALPGAEAAAKAAERAVSNIRDSLFSAARSDLLRDYQDAEAAWHDAKVVRDAAGERAGVWHSMGPHAAPLPPDVRADIAATIDAHR